MDRDHGDYGVMTGWPNDLRLSAVFGVVSSVFLMVWAHCFRDTAVFGALMVTVIFPAGMGLAFAFRSGSVLDQAWRSAAVAGIVMLALLVLECGWFQSLCIASAAGSGIFLSRHLSELPDGRWAIGRALARGLGYSIGLMVVFGVVSLYYYRLGGLSVFYRTVPSYVQAFMFLVAFAVIGRLSHKISWCLHRHRVQNREG